MILLAVVASILVLAVGTLRAPPAETVDAVSRLGELAWGAL